MQGIQGFDCAAMHAAAKCITSSFGVICEHDVRLPVCYHSNSVAAMSTTQGSLCSSCRQRHSCCLSCSCSCTAVRVTGVRDWRFNQRAEDIEWLLRLSAADGSASTVSWQILYNIASQQQWGELQRFLCPKLAQLRAFCQSQAIQKPGTGAQWQRQHRQQQQHGVGCCHASKCGIDSHVNSGVKMLAQQLHIWYPCSACAMRGTSQAWQPAAG